MKTDLLNDAVNYTMYPRRWSIFPCAPRGKAPLTEHGLNDASNDSDDAWAWWERWPQANIGLRTGGGIIVLDEDGEEGRASLAALQAQHGALPTTMQAQSGRMDGGTHYYFAYAGDDIGNSAGRIGKGLDVRGTGGYIIIPPSVHETGRRYTWLNDLEPAPLPEWLRLLMLPPKQAAPRPIIRPDDAMTRARAWLSKVDPAAEGGRDNQVFNLAGNLLAFGLGEGEVVALLTGFNLLLNPPLPERTVLEKVRSAMHNGTPRQPKPNRPPAYVRLAMAHAHAGGAE